MSQQGELIPAAGVSRGRLSEIAKLGTLDAVKQNSAPQSVENPWNLLPTCSRTSRTAPDTVRQLENSMFGISPQVWFPIVTLIAGAILKAVFDAINDARLANRERQARKEQRTDSIREGRVNFQRSTLLELQDVAVQVARFTAQSNFQDILAYKKTGVWKRQPLSDDVNEGYRKAQVQLKLLRVRIRDAELRRFADDLSKSCAWAVLAADEPSANAQLLSMSSHLDGLQERAGQVLRSLDEDEDKLLAP